MVLLGKFDGANHLVTQKNIYMFGWKQVLKDMLPFLLGI